MIKRLGKFILTSSELHLPVFALRMIFRKRPWCLGIWRILCSAAVMMVAVFLAIMSLNLCYHFHPRNATEVIAPSGNSNRAFTQIGGFVDISVDLYASDWPWTFSRPALLGDLYWPEVQKSSAVYWSVDGSVIAFQRHRHEDVAPMFCTAYDYRNHKLIGSEYRLGSPSESELRIVALLKERGGMGSPETGLDDYKRDPGPDMFPAWGWIAPVALILGGVWIVRRLRAKANELIEVSG